MARCAGSGQRAGKVDPVEGEDDVGCADELRRVRAQEVPRRARMQTVLRREDGPDLEVCDYSRIEVFGQLDASLPILRVRLTRPSMNSGR